MFCLKKLYLMNTGPSDTLHHRAHQTFQEINSICIICGEVSIHYDL